MNHQQIMTIATEALLKISPDRKQLNVSTSMSELDLDSLDILEWCMEIEQRLHIELDVAQLAETSNIGELIDEIARSLAAGQS